MTIEANISESKAKIPATPAQIDLKTTTLMVIKRDGNLVPFDATRISIAITKAFWEVEGDAASNSSRLKEIVTLLTDKVTEVFHERISVNGRAIHIEEIQDQVEIALTRHGHHQVSRSYVLYRDAHRKMRETAVQSQPRSASDIEIILDNGSKSILNLDVLKGVVTEACSNLEAVDPEPIIADTLRNIFNGIHLKDVRQALILTARTLIEQEPNYSYVAARLLLKDLQLEVMRFLQLPIPKNRIEMAQQYAATLATSIRRGIEVNMLDAKLGAFDLDKLGRALKPERDFQFTYLGLQTLYDRYFLHQEGHHFEMPQTFFMRVAMGLALEEKDKEARAIEFYDLLSSFDFMSSTPTLFNSGTIRSQLSSCFLTTVPDDLNGIYNAIRDNALLSKFAGGLGNDWTSVRALGAHIKGTNGKSQGVVPFLKVSNDTAVAVNQGGKRKGAFCAYLEAWHLDIEEFTELRKNTGDERRRTPDMNTAIWIPDLLPKRVIENKDWTLFSPNDVPDLHEIYGKDFEVAYAKYEAMADSGKIKNFKRLPAVTLWRKMLAMVFETGHPWFTFKDPCNIRSPQSHVGTIHSSNLCTEITLNTSEEEIAVCNLGSINLAQHVTENGLDIEKIRKTVKTAVRMLDNVIDINYYAVIQARRSNLRHRPIGLGLMGFQDCLYKLDIAYDSEEAVEFADRSMEHISYAAILASTDLAEERGVYSTYEGSLWSRGILPIDSIEMLQEARGVYLDQDRSQTLDWAVLRKRVQTVGMRNSNVLAIAPTATISNICGVSQSIEPTYQNLYVKSNLSGEFTVINPYLVKDLKARGIWDSAMVKDLKYFNGSVRSVNRIPEDLRKKYSTVFEIDAKWLIEAGSRRQKWIDQAQSLNLYISAPSGKKLDILYRTAWLRGLKTTYYLRSLGATDAEKSTVYDGALSAVKITMDAPMTTGKICPIDDPACEACE